MFPANPREKKSPSSPPRYEVLFSPLPDGNYVDNLYEFAFIIMSICLFYFNIVLQLTILLSLRLFSSNDGGGGGEDYQMLKKWSSGPTLSLKYIFYQYNILDISNGIIMFIVLLLSYLLIYILLLKCLSDSLQWRRRNIGSIFIINSIGYISVNGMGFDIIFHIILNSLISLLVLIRLSLDDIDVIKSKSIPILPISRDDDDNGVGNNERLLSNQ